MPRRIVYGLGIWATAIAHNLDNCQHRITSLDTLGECESHGPSSFAAFGGCQDMTSLTSPQDIGNDIKFSYGLSRKCSTVTGTCDPFPSEVDCKASGPLGGAGGETFCELWRSVGFAMSFAVIIELAAWTAFAVILLGGVQQRNQGWKMVCGLLTTAAVVQAAGMSIVAYLYDHDERFSPPGWKLDVSWILCTVSWSLLALTGMGIGAATYASPSEGGYELIPDS